jgi:hypothetical protein
MILVSLLHKIVYLIMIEIPVCARSELCNDAIVFFNRTFYNEFREFLSKECSPAG